MTPSPFRSKLGTTEPLRAQIHYEPYANKINVDIVTKRLLKAVAQCPRVSVPALVHLVGKWNLL